MYKVYIMPIEQESYWPMTILQSILTWMTMAWHDNSNFLDEWLKWSIFIHFVWLATLIYTIWPTRSAEFLEFMEHKFSGSKKLLDSNNI